MTKTSVLLAAALVFWAVGGHAKDAGAEPIFEGGFQGKWQDFGWTPRDVETGKPARLNFSNYGGWSLGRRSSDGPQDGVAVLSFRMLAPPTFGNFLEVHVRTTQDDTFPRVSIDQAHRRIVEGGWVEVRVAMNELNPQGLRWDRLILQAARNVSAEWVQIDRIGFGSAAAPSNAVGDASSEYPVRKANMQIDCSRGGPKISPRIYGISFKPNRFGQDPHQFSVGATIRKWGGNSSSRYNWNLGNAWNASSDWYFTNINYTGKNDFSWSTFLEENRKHDMASAMTIPMLGWVAKDTKSYAFPVSMLGQQRSVAGDNPDVGNGVRPDGTLITATDPQRTSVVASADFMGNWVTAMQKQRNRGVAIYYLDNEPMLWSTTHRDVHPQATTYDELLERTIAYGTAIRKADREATIAGPCEGSWSGYFFSALDKQMGLDKKPDRRAHGDAPLLEWYLQKLRAHEKKTGMRVLDLVDLHFFPQGEGIANRTDAETAARRIRATRALWDQTYVDESWINEPVRLIPRLRSMISQNYPGLGISIGEYNFGGENHMSGALAEAEALGRFGEERVDAAFYAGYPADKSPLYYAFRAFRNFDNEGGRFLDRSISATGDRTTSLFASTNDAGHVVAVALNFDPREGADANIFVSGCGSLQNTRVYQYTGGSGGFTQQKITPSDGHILKTRLAPYSITVIDIKSGR